MDLSIIIVNWNSREYLDTCIASILANTHGIEYEILVVDSASFDGCEEMLRQKYQQVRFVQSSTNQGFAKANNRAYAASTGRVVLFLNPDTELVGSPINVMYVWLCSLPDAGAVGCTLLNSDRSVQSSCIQSFPTVLNQLLDSEYLRSKWPRSSLWGMAALQEKTTAPREVEAISGACMMMKSSTFEQVGRFSADYFMYAEDIDLCYKLREAGFKNYYVPEAVLVHHGGGSSQQTTSNFTAVMMREAVWRFLRKTRGAWYGRVYRTAMAAAALGRLSVLGLAQLWEGGRRRDDAIPGSISKWLSVLRWCLNRKDVIRRYYPPL